MTFVSHDNRRAHGRHAAGLKGTLSIDGESVDGTIENVGEGGVFFATTNLELAVDDGDAVSIAFVCRRSGADETIERSGVVLRTERYFDGSGVVRAVAVKFDDPISLEDVVLS